MKYAKANHPAPTESMVYPNALSPSFFSYAVFSDTHAPHEDSTYVDWAIQNDISSALFFQVLLATGL